MVSFIKDCTDEDFITYISDYIQFDALLNYYCFVYLSTGVDNLAKNMLMVTYDRILWYPSLYDLDSLWGVDWTGLGYTAYDRKCPTEYECNISVLWEKLERCFPDELSDRYF